LLLFYYYYTADKSIFTFLPQPVTK